MFPMLELTAVDGQPLDIPLTTVTHVQGLNEGENEANPEARAFIRYQMGRNLHSLVVATNADEIIRLMNVHAEPTGKWLVMSQKENGERVLIRADRLCLRQGQADGGTYINYYVDESGETIEGLTVIQSRDDLVKMVTPTTPEPKAAPKTPRKPKGKVTRGQ